MHAHIVVSTVAYKKLCYLLLAFRQEDLESVSDTFTKIFKVEFHV